MSEQVAVAQEADAQVAEVEKRTDDVADIDSLLAEFDQGTKTPPSPPEPKIAKEEAVPAWAQDLQRRFMQEDVKKVTDEIFDGMEVSDRLRIAWIDQIAREKPGVQKAFMNRHNDPSAWNKVLKGLKPEAQKDFPQARKVDPEATADHEAVAQAVRGASTKVAADPAPDFSKMSNAEFQKWKQENMG